MLSRRDWENIDKEAEDYRKIMATKTTSDQSEIACLKATIADRDKEIAELRAEVERLKRELTVMDNGYCERIGQLFQEYSVKASEASLVAWNDAIEAAAEAADYCRRAPFTTGMGMQPVLDAILALRRPTQDDTQ